MAKKNDKQKNSFYVRIYDDELLQSIYELDNTKQYSSMNDLMTQALAIGINEIYKTFGKKKVLDAASINNVNTLGADVQNLIKNIKYMGKKVDDVFVMLNIIELLNTTTYNAFHDMLAGETVTAEQLDSGYYSMLPDNLAEVKNELIKHANKR